MTPQLSAERKTLTEKLWFVHVHGSLRFSFGRKLYTGNPLRSNREGYLGERGKLIDFPESHQKKGLYVSGTEDFT